MKARIFSIIAAAVVFSGCAQKSSIDVVVNAATGLGAAETKLQVVDPQLAKIKCQDLCRVEMTKGTDLSAGPCLGNPIAGIETWVCDVAHNPRQSVDNKPENQCSAFRAGLAKHFVEVDEECNIIKTY